MAVGKSTTHRGKDVRPRKSYETLPVLCERLDGETVEEYRRRYAKARYHYLKANDPGFAQRNCEIVAATKARDPEKIRLRKLEYCQRNRDREKERAARWLKDNRERGLATRRSYYQENKSLVRARNAEWAAKNPDKVYAIKHAQRTKGRAAGGRFTADDINRIFQQQRGKCALCKVKLGANKHLDHIQPIHKGGTNHPRNLQWLCAPCNQRKSHKDPIDFSRELGLLL